MTLALVVPILTGTEAHLETALNALTEEVLTAVQARGVFAGDGELVLVSDAEDVGAFADALAAPGAKPLALALEQFTAHQANAPGRYVLRSVADAKLPVPGSPHLRPGFATGSG